MLPGVQRHVLATPWAIDMRFDPAAGCRRGTLEQVVDHAAVVDLHVADDASRDRAPIRQLSTALRVEGAPVEHHAVVLAHEDHLGFEVEEQRVREVQALGGGHVRRYTRAP